MKPEQQRIAIADACGLFRIEPLRRTTRKGKLDENGVKLWYCEEHHGGVGTYTELPSYLTDLNAMHKAEISAGFHRYPLRERYYPFLIEAKDRDGTDLPMWMATADQRAEAFLKTLGLWKP